MPQKTKAQLREELEEAKRELADARADHAAELAALRESERRLKESEAQLQEDVEELRRRVAESDRELTEAMVELSLAQDKVEKLEGSTDRRVRLASPSDSTTDFDPGYSEVGSLIRLREIEDARDDALEALDKAQWELDKMSRDSEYQMLRVKSSLREELEQKYQNDIRTRDELIELLRAKLSGTTHVEEPRISGGGSSELDTPMTLPLQVGLSFLRYQGSLAMTATVLRGTLCYTSRFN